MREVSGVVALRKESVDRNQNGRNSQYIKRVALRKESVDRNLLAAGSLIMIGGSLSARRAWIEIANFCRNRFCPSRSPQGERG